jgi:hypothetical protein
MATLAQHPALASVALLFFAGIASAHQSLESTDSFWVRPTGIEAEIYMSRGAADLLVAREGEMVTIVRDNFGVFQARLAAVGPSLLSVAGEDGATLVADASKASMTDEDDICFSLHYPLPKGALTALKIHGNYLDRMDVGHIGSIYVLNATDDLLGSGEIRADSPDFEVHLQAVSDKGRGTAALPAAPSVQPVAMAQARTRPWGIWCAAGGALLVIAVLGWRAMARSKSGPRQGT